MPIMGGERSRVSDPIYLIPELDGQLPRSMDEYTHSVQIGVTLTATAVHLDAVVKRMSKAETSAPLHCLVLHIGFNHRDKYTVVLS